MNLFGSKHLSRTYFPARLRVQVMKFLRALAVISVTPNKLLNLSESQFPHLKDGNSNDTYLVVLAVGIG